MTTGIDELMRSPAAQEFWLRRLIATIVDYAILFFPIYSVGAIAWALPMWSVAPWLVGGALVVVYSAVFEAELGYTIGKRLMNLEVVPLDMRPYDIRRAIVRNLSKIYPGVLLLDVVLAFLMENRPNMRYLDATTQCEVVDTTVAAQRRKAGLAPMPVGVHAEAAGPVTVEHAAPTMPPEPASPEQPARLPVVPVEIPPKDTAETPARRPTGRAPPPIPGPPQEPSAPPEPDLFKGEAMADYGTDLEEVPPPRAAKKGAAEGWEEMGSAEELPDK